MSDLRYESIFDRWVCVAENRTNRPVEFSEVVKRATNVTCPFCAGHESETPDPVLSYSAPHHPTVPDEPWLVRVVPNRYPAFYANGNRAFAAAATPPWMSGEQGSMGFQEVIVLTPRHVDSFTELNQQELFTAFSVFRERIRYYADHDAIQHTCLFMNCRAQAGASIEHIHFQLVASPICSSHTQNLFQRMAEKVTPSDNSSLQTPLATTRWQQQLAWEIDTETRLLTHTENFTAFAPFASRYAFQVRLAPRHELPAFHLLETAQCEELATLCFQVSQALDICLDHPAYNIVFNLPPRGSENTDWFIEFLPRTTQSGGFEIGTDCWINATSPETAAKLLRETGKLG